MNTVTINNQKIAWSFIFMLRKKLGGSWDSTMDAFWQARNAEGENGITKYIIKGLQPDAQGRRYILYPSKEREAGNMQKVRDWWEGEVYQRKRAPQSTGNILRDILAGNLS